MVLGLLAHVTPSIFFNRFLRSEALVYNSFFFSEQPFYGNYLTLDSHANTVISHAFAYSSRWCRKPWQGWSIGFASQKGDFVFHFSFDFICRIPKAPREKNGLDVSLVEE